MKRNFHRKKNTFFFLRFIHFLVGVFSQIGNGEDLRGVTGRLCSGTDGPAAHQCSKEKERGTFFPLTWPLLKGLCERFVEAHQDSILLRYLFDNKLAIHSLHTHTSYTAVCVCGNLIALKMIRKGLYKCPAISHVEHLSAVRAARSTDHHHLLL